MKNTLKDLNNHLFAELERLSDEDLKGEALEEEISRARAVTSIAAKVIDNGNLVLRAMQTQKEILGDDRKIPDMLEG